MDSFLPRGVLIAAAVLALFPAPDRLCAWTLKQAPLMTRWAKDVDPTRPLPEYPRPQMVRPDWLSLNGIWEYQPGTQGDPLPTGRKLGSEILVPFPVESALSGVMEHHDRLWYRRLFNVPAAWQGRRMLLHFGAVDFESEVFVNGRSAGVHKGGYLPFTYDVTSLLTPDGPQELIVRVFDPTDEAGEPRGKQTLHPGGIMYTATTGIWQTVWLEPVDVLSIDSLKIVPDVNGGAVKITVNAVGTTANTAGVKVGIFDPDKARQAAAERNVHAPPPTGVGVSGLANAELRIPLPNAKLWTPDHPFLYSVEVTLTNGREIVDRVHSYFGMRKIEIGDDHGVKKMLLNGEFVFEFGPLDQGFWPDGIYTAPTDAAQKNDIETMKACGFNLVRKHLKVEPARWYYWCDRLGLLVWQDMPSANSYVDEKVRLPPPLDGPEFDSELTRMVQTLWNAPSIVMWDLFNEGQGQHDTAALVERVRKLDPSRLVNEASGGERTGHGDVADVHYYPPPACPPPQAAQALVCGEYGGIGYHLSGHTWAAGGGGYTNVATSDAILERYNEYAGTIRGFRDRQGLSAAVYTQLTDVETEINGLMTYDRVNKVDPAALVAANRLEYLPRIYRPVVPTSEEGPAQIWRYTNDRPPEGWQAKLFDDARWREGPAGFGKHEALGRTPWKTPDIWLRRHFDPGALSEEALRRLVLKVFYDDDVEVFINGVLAYAHDGYLIAYEYGELREAAVRALVAGGDNVLAVHCRQKTGGQYIDAGLSERLPLEKR